MQEKLKKLPIGESDITRILTNGFIYVDKTKYIYEMLDAAGKYFLSRPRRFGKTTLVSTLYEVFKGNKELFKDQWIYNSDWDWQEYPIIRIDFNVSISANLPEYIKQTLKDIATVYDVFDETQYNESSYDMYFRTVVTKLYRKYNQRVVILIDEYDKPILDEITNTDEAVKRRDILKGFYTVIKGLDEYIRFVFLTGVTKFSKVGVFSGLNNLNDISMDKNYAAVCGITQEELEHNYKGYIEQLAQILNISYSECLKKIKESYNGFSFSRHTHISVYNPFSTLLLFQKQEFSNYWFATGSPSFLIKLIKQSSDLELFKFDEYELSESQFNSFEVDDLNINAILLQAGYLTIKRYLNDSELYILGYPNLEIEKSFKENVFASFGKSKTANQSRLNDITKALKINDIEAVIDHLKQIFLNIDYDVQISREQHYQSIVYLIFQLLGYRINTEYKTNIGRIDAIVQTDNSIYIFEFKVDKTAIDALTQIKDKSYYERFLSHGKPIYLIGINFSSTSRNIDEYIIEVLDRNAS